MTQPIQPIQNPNAGRPVETPEMHNEAEAMNQDFDEVKNLVDGGLAQPLAEHMVGTNRLLKTELTSLREEVAGIKQQNDDLIEANKAQETRIKRLKRTAFGVGAVAVASVALAASSLLGAFGDVKENTRTVTEPTPTMTDKPTTPNIKKAGVFDSSTLITADMKPLLTQTTDNEGQTEGNDARPNGYDGIGNTSTAATGGVEAGDPTLAPEPAEATPGTTSVTRTVKAKHALKLYRNVDTGSDAQRLIGKFNIDQNNAEKSKFRFFAEIRKNPETLAEMKAALDVKNATYDTTVGDADVVAKMNKLKKQYEGMSAAEKAPIADAVIKELKTMKYNGVSIHNGPYKTIGVVDGKLVPLNNTRFNDEWISFTDEDGNTLRIRKCAQIVEDTPVKITTTIKTGDKVGGQPKITQTSDKTGGKLTPGGKPKITQTGDAVGGKVKTTTPPKTSHPAGQPAGVEGQNGGDPAGHALPERPVAGDAPAGEAGQTQLTTPDPLHNEAAPTAPAVEGAPTAAPHEVAVGTAEPAPTADPDPQG